MDPFATGREPFIQIAGVIDRVEAQMLGEEGVHFLGFPLRLAVHKEDLSEEEAADIIRNLPPEHRGVVITYLTDPLEISSFLKKMGTRSVQLHAPMAPAALRELRRLRPDLWIIKSLIVRGDDEARLDREATDLGEWVDAFITDTYDPATGATGATGKTHDWSISEALVSRSPRPVILAGGLNPANVAEAIAAVRPAGVDVHTGVEGCDGRKDRLAVRAFVEATRSAYAALEIDT
ncbi:N-(5'-phosphoribosyl)anthranilate isomerase [Sulfidibacter corallicola]|uniref:N-(5'-phosphoribosyl)anthranilate isomerase n=1 Tax=Sulfidibacter corallicola TaxID=2818388 RepID=A0A8A4TEC0_SULCO|nr:phosphoribosylanthranilate isomerase [Sulfidibacter corallicola]QTD47910.1 phosphoribosylanthranilate isomerase [Sulfidibacter corallicola]